MSSRSQVALLALAFVVIYFVASGFLIYFNLAPLVIALSLVMLLIWVATMARVGGWRRLAVLYRANVVFSGARRSVIAAQMGAAGAPYSFLKVGADSRGMHLSMPALLSIGHPSLYVPWQHLQMQEGTFSTSAWVWGGSHQLLIRFLKVPDVTLRIQGREVVDMLLSHAAASAPEALTKDAETQEAASQVLANPPRPRSPVFVWSVGLLIAGVILYGEWTQDSDRRMRQKMTGVEAEASRILNSIRAPAGAVRVGAPVVNRGALAGGSNPLGYLFLRQDYSRPGSFDDTAAWYDKELTSQGWINEGMRAANEIDYCRGEWSVDLEATDRWGTEEHKYRVDVNWSTSPRPCASQSR